MGKTQKSHQALDAGLHGWADRYFWLDASGNETGKQPVRRLCVPAGGAGIWHQCPRRMAVPRDLRGDGWSKLLARIMVRAAPTKYRSRHERHVGSLLPIPKGAKRELLLRQYCLMGNPILSRTRGHGCRWKLSGSNRIGDEADGFQQQCPGL